MKPETAIIYLTGKPGVGKYTVAKALSASHGFIICDNQLINNPIFELLDYDGYATIPDSAWETIGHIRTEILGFLSRLHENSYVLTNCLAEIEEDRAIYHEVEQMAEARGSLFVPVCLTVHKDEHAKRITRPERRERWKSIDLKHTEDNGPLLSITHPNTIHLDVTDLRAEEAARKIMEHMEVIEGE